MDLILQNIYFCLDIYGNKFAISNMRNKYNFADQNVIF